MDIDTIRSQAMQETRKRETFEHNGVELVIHEWTVAQWERFQKIEAWDMEALIKLAMENVTTPDGRAVFEDPDKYIESVLQGPARADALGRTLNVEQLKINGYINDDPVVEIDAEQLQALALECESADALGDAVMELLEEVDGGGVLAGLVGQLAEQTDSREDLGDAIIDLLDGLGEDQEAGDPGNSTTSEPSSTAPDSKDDSEPTTSG